MFRLEQPSPPLFHHNLDLLNDYVNDMVAPLDLGAMTTLRDHDCISYLDVDFFELLVLEDDDVQDLESLLSRDDRCQIVHVPEKMIINGRPELIDLAEEDHVRRDIFIHRVNEISTMAASLSIPTVIHPGGVHADVVNRNALHSILKSSLAELDGILWLENMPLHYHIDGEMQYCNLCTSPDEFIDLLPYLDGITLDVSHAYLSVRNNGNITIASFFEELYSSIKHIHLSDAKYPDGEGLQLGDGDVDFSAIPHIESVPVLLEIWNGHLNNGAGFAEALRRVRSANSWFKRSIFKD